MTIKGANLTKITTVFAEPDTRGTRPGMTAHSWLNHFEADIHARNRRRDEQRIDEAAAPECFPDQQEGDERASSDHQALLLGGDAAERGARRIGLVRKVDGLELRHGL